MTSAAEHSQPGQTRQGASNPCALLVGLIVHTTVDIEASNRKGRTALSFAAAPSRHKGVPRATAVDAMKLLLLHGAKSDHADNNGKTPKDHAEREGRYDAIDVLRKTLVKKEACEAMKKTDLCTTLVKTKR